MSPRCIHVVLLGVILSGVFISHEVVQQVARLGKLVTLIAPSPDSFILPASKKIISGGGGGGDRDRLPAPKGHPPKTALQQITPPAIVIRNEKPKLQSSRRWSLRPQVHLAENHMPNLGVSTACPIMPASSAFEWNWLWRWYRFRLWRRRRRRSRTGRRCRNWRRHRWRCLHGRRRYFRSYCDLFSRSRLYGRGAQSQEARDVRSLAYC